MNKMSRCILAFLIIFVFVFVPLKISRLSIDTVWAEEEYYPWDITVDTIRGSEYPTIADEVYVYDGATLTMEGGNHDFQNVIDVSGSNSKIIFEEGSYIFKGDVSVYDKAEFIFKKGSYTFEKDISFGSGAKWTIEKGASIKFKKTSNYVPALWINDASVSAIGTQDERIIFSPEDETSNDYEIHISGYLDNAISKFDYVDFIGGGKYWEGVPQASIFDMFIKTAHAETMLNGIPTLSVLNAMVQISNSKFSNGNYYPISNKVYNDKYLAINYSFLKISDTDFVDNTNHLAVNSEMNCTYENGCYKRVILENNWYGSSDGPRTEENQERDGDFVSGPAVINGWSSEMHFPEIDPNAVSNVLFLPGLEASRLYGDENSTCALDEDNMKKAWEPNCNDDVRWLYLNEDGKSVNTINTKVGDIVDETPSGANIYKSFIEKMDEMKNIDKSINDWKPVAYDWRLSLDDILEDGKVIDQLRNLAENSKTKKVTIVAHSNGGLLAKALMQKIGDEDAKNIVDKIIFVAVPQVGTPAAIAGLLHGKDQRLVPVLNTKTARGFGENMPGAYNLLPSSKYFSTVETPVIEFKTQQSDDWKDLFDTKITSENGLHKFLADDFRRVSATDSDTNTPSKLNEKLLENAENTHDDLDSWIAPAGIKIIQIAGWGVKDTLSSTEYGTQDKKICNGVCQSGVDYLDPDFKFTIDGDGTVVSPSALWMSGVERYWVDLDSYNIFLIRHSDHARILEIPSLLSFIEDSIINKTRSLFEYRYLSAEVPPSSDDKRLQYSLHSPLTLELIDNKGRRTGIDADGKITEQIPGTYFTQFGDVKYIFADEDIVSHIEMKGYDTGTFTFAIEEFKGDESLGKITFKDVPTTNETSVKFNVVNDLESASNLEIDKDGDNVNDFILEPKIGEIVVFDNIAPTTNPTITGTQGINNWYTSDVELTLSANDNENGTGVAKTEYSLDNGVIWREYLNPIVFTQEGNFDIPYRSIDKQGNIEEIKKVTIKIDKTTPEAKIIFNSQTQKLDIIGTDNLSRNVDVKSTEQIIFIENKQDNKKNKFWPWGWFQKSREKKTIVTATLTDEAGHKTEIVWEKRKDKDRRIDLAISSISYDGQKTDINKGILQYKWMQDWKRKKYLLFASHIGTNQMSIESHYLPKQNQTWIMEKPNEIADDDSDDSSEKRPVRKKLPGMVIPGIITEQGKLKISY